MNELLVWAQGRIDQEEANAARLEQHIRTRFERYGEWCFLAAREACACASRKGLLEYAMMEWINRGDSRPLVSCWERFGECNSHRELAVA